MIKSECYILPPTVMEIWSLQHFQTSFLYKRFIFHWTRTVLKHDNGSLIGTKHSVLTINLKWTLVGPLCWWSGRWLGDVLHRRRQAAGWQPVWWIKAMSRYIWYCVVHLAILHCSCLDSWIWVHADLQQMFMYSTLWFTQSCTILRPSMVHPALSFHTHRNRVQVRDGSGKNLLVDTFSRCRNYMV